jgi:hypothetical protein
MVTHSEMWHHYVPESGNWHDGTFTRWIAALSAAPNSCCHKKYSLRHPRYDLSATFRGLEKQLYHALLASLYSKVYMGNLGIIWFFVPVMIKQKIGDFP